MKNLYIWGRGKGLDGIPYRLTNNEAEGYEECLKKGIPFKSKRLKSTISTRNFVSLDDVKPGEALQFVKRGDRFFEVYWHGDIRMVDEDGKEAFQEEDKENLYTEDEYFETRQKMLSGGDNKELDG